MQAIIVKSPGGVDQLAIESYAMPTPGPDELLVKVEATALNRADILQRKGKYPPPKGASELIGLELAGTVAQTGGNVKKWKEGDRVFGLLPGGGYAQYAVIHEDMAMPAFSHLSFEEAAAIPEVFLTAFQSLVWLGKIQNQERVLIHAGASGVGSAAIQLAGTFQAEIMVTASAAKHEFCLNLGAHQAIDYKNESFEERVRELTGGKGVDLILDFIGGSYFSGNLNSLAFDGRLIMLALMGGAKPDQADLRKVLGKRLTIIGTTLRARSLAYQIRLTQEFKTYAFPLFESGKLKPVVDKVFDWKDVAEAHTYMEENRNAGKIVLKVS